MQTLTSAQNSTSFSIKQVHPAQSQPPQQQFDHQTYPVSYPPQIANLPVFTSAFSPIPMQPMYQTQAVQPKITRAEEETPTQGAPLQVQQIQILSKHQAIPVIAAPTSDQLGYLDHFLGYFQ